MRYGLYAFKTTETAALISDLTLWLREEGAEVVDLAPRPRSIGRMDSHDSGHMDESGVDILVALGGDGTLLGAARSAAPLGIPILGVNLGHLGFLTEVEVPDVKGALAKTLSGSFTVEKRMMIEASVLRDDQKVHEVSGLNDAVINKSGFSRMVTMDVYVGSSFVQTVPADGVIVSSPTGSTAYSLSSGGPIVNPLFECLIITPICPHTLYSRSQVISGDEEVRVVLVGCRGDVNLTVDGQIGFELRAGDAIFVRRSPHSARFIRLGSRNFYRILSEKLRERPSHDPDCEEDGLSEESKTGNNP